MIPELNPALIELLKSQKIALLWGGNSSEREVSKMSADSIYQALSSLGYQLEMVDLKDYNLFNLKQDGFQLVFNIAHGGDGENGVVQAVLEYLEIPYTGPNSEQSSLTFNKAFTKDVWNSALLPVANYISIFKGQLDSQALLEVYNDLEDQGIIFVKPARDGSSLGVSKVTNPQQLEAAVELAFKNDNQILLETAVNGGAEFSVSVYGGIALEPAQIIYQGEFYDYQAKYFNDSTQVAIPAPISAELREKLMNLAQDAVHCLGIDSWCRVDILSDAQQQLYLIELNTVPGMTSHSIFPGSMLGKNYAQVCEYILATALLK